MDFSGSAPPPGGKIGTAEREQMMDQVKSQLAIANAQDLLQKMSDKCFKKCVTKPGTSLDNSEQ
ncbi:mitochondrial import inner membrane translocase subunit Tim13-like, partial [Saccoglossus kowalevskii]